MTDKQKSYYKSLLLTIFGILFWFGGFICAIILGFIFKNGISVAICIFISLIGFITFILDNNISVIFQLHFNTYPNIFYKYVLYGVPNNKLNEFQINVKEIYQCNLITAYEYEDGKFKVLINEKELFFDLRGWHNKSYCLYEYFISIIQVDLSKMNPKMMRKSIYTNKNFDIRLVILFKNGREKGFDLIKNNKSFLMRKFKHRLAIKQDCLKLEKISLYNLYDFNI